MSDTSIPSLSVNKESGMLLTIPLSDSTPSLSLSDQSIPHATALNTIFTNTQVLTNGFSIAPGWFMYVTQQQLITMPDQDILPILAFADSVTPHLALISDVYTPPVPTPKNSGMLIGMLGLTYP